jgi:hypothetical protein
MFFKIADSWGFVVAHDIGQTPPSDEKRNRAELARELKARAREGDVFVVDREDEIASLGAELLLDQPIPPTVAGMYEALGGTFLLRAPTGQLSVSGLDAWIKGAQLPAFAVPPGDYALCVHSREHPDMQEYQRILQRVLGHSNWNLTSIADKLALLGCLPTILGALSLLIRPVRAYAWWVLAAVALCWLPHVVLRSLPRYRAATHRQKEFEQSLPLFYLALTPLRDSQLAGGFITPQP